MGKVVYDPIRARDQLIPAVDSITEGLGLDVDREYLAAAAARLLDEAAELIAEEKGLEVDCWVDEFDLATVAVYMAAADILHWLDFAADEARRARVSPAVPGRLRYW